MRTLARSLLVAGLTLASSAFSRAHADTVATAPKAAVVSPVQYRVAPGYPYGYRYYRPYAYPYAYRYYRPYAYPYYRPYAYPYYGPYAYPGYPYPYYRPYAYPPSPFLSFGWGGPGWRVGLGFGW